MKKKEKAQKKIGKTKSDRCSSDIQGSRGADACEVIVVILVLAICSIVTLFSSAATLSDPVTLWKLVQSRGKPGPGINGVKVYMLHTTFETFQCGLKCLREIVHFLFFLCSAAYTA